MNEIILQAMKNCAKKYAKGIPRYEHLWQDLTPIPQQADQVAGELEAMDYRLLKIIPFENEKQTNDGNK